MNIVNSIDMCKVIAVTHRGAGRLCISQQEVVSRGLSFFDLVRKWLLRGLSFCYCSPLKPRKPSYWPTKVTPHFGEDFSPRAEAEVGSLRLRRSLPPINVRSFFSFTFKMFYYIHENIRGDRLLQSNSHFVHRF